MNAHVSVTPRFSKVDAIRTLGEDAYALRSAMSVAPINRRGT
jgi:hypothetical protein